MTWIDISQPLHSGMPVWPGDAPFQYEFTYTKEESGSVNVGQVQMSTHTGTHIDAPFHFDEAGSKVNRIGCESLYRQSEGHSFAGKRKNQGGGPDGKRMGRDKPPADPDRFVAGSERVSRRNLSFWIRMRSRI